MVILQSLSTLLLVYLLCISACTSTSPQIDIRESAASASPVIKGSCELAGYSTCCLASVSDGCYGSDYTCHCDSDCHRYDDCCDDIYSLDCTLALFSDQGSCVAAGFEECCQDESSCHGSPPTCYCDASCYLFDDCCSDIASIGCIVSPSNSTSHEGSCVSAEYTSCCVPSDTQQCLGYPGTCRCDQMCFEEGDCCSDVTDIGCLPLNGSCIASGHKTCCLNEDALNCTGVPATCYCDQGCFDRDDCCSDIDKLSNCQHSITGSTATSTFITITSLVSTVSTTSLVRSSISTTSLESTVSHTTSLLSTVSSMTSLVPTVSSMRSLVSSISTSSLISTVSSTWSLVSTVTSTLESTISTSSQESISMSTLVSTVSSTPSLINTSSSSSSPLVATSSELSSSSLVVISSTTNFNPGHGDTFWSQENYKAILGVSFGAIGFALVVTAACFSVLIICKRKRKRRLEMRYKLVSFDEPDEDDDDDD